MDVSTSSSPADTISPYKVVYYHLPTALFCGCIPAKRRSDLLWKPTIFHLILGVITQVSDSNNRVAWKTAL